MDKRGERNRIQDERRGHEGRKKWRKENRISEAEERAHERQRTGKGKVSEGGREGMEQNNFL